MSQKIKGFTLIELVMVIVIISILSAFALPKFTDLFSSVRQTKNETISTSFKQGVTNAKIMWVVEGKEDTGSNQGPTVLLSNDTITVENGTGYPVGSERQDRAVRMSSVDCETVFTDVLDTDLTVLRRRSSNNPNRENRRAADYLSTRQNSNPDICHYYFTDSLPDSQNNPTNNATPSIGKGFSYQPDTGKVTVFDFD